MDHRPTEARRVAILNFNSDNPLPHLTKNGGAVGFTSAPTVPTAATPEWTDQYIRTYIQIKTNEDSPNYNNPNDLLFTQFEPLEQDFSTYNTPKDALRVDTLIKCPDLLDRGQQFFTNDSNSGLLRRVNRQLEQSVGDSKQVEEVDFVNVLYHKVNPNVSSLKRVHIDVDTVDTDLDEIEPPRHMDGSKSQMVLHFKPTKKARYPEEQSFQVVCNQDFRLNRPFDMQAYQRRFKMGLIDIWLNQHYHNIKDKEMWLAVVSQDASHIGEADRQYIPQGHYTDMREVVDVIGRHLLGVGTPACIGMREQKWTVLYPHTATGQEKLVLNPALAELFGHTPNTCIDGLTFPLDESHPSQSLQGTSTPDLKAGFRILYVYCDLVKPQIVGDSRARFLEQVVPHFDAKTGEFFMQIANPNYVPLVDNLSTVSSINVVVTDSLGRDLTYDYADQKPKATLHMTVN